KILTQEVRDIWIRKGPECFQNKNCDFSETCTSFPDSSGKIKTRYLTRNIFTRKLTNGECLERKWLLYSPSKKSVYCYCCRLFNTTTGIGHNLSSPNGYKDWKHINLSHVDQLTFIVRYVKDGKPIEIFVEFLPMDAHNTQYIANTILNLLESLDIPIKDCRGQSYDNASNMAGKYSGVRQE
ncbi:hypothetical protein NQ318_023544, partial [Aromia moschata]